VPSLRAREKAVPESVRSVRKYWAREAEATTPCTAI